MAEYRITFGVRYNHEQHHLLPGVTGEHYVTIIADNAAECREIALRHLGRYWAFDYPKPEGGWDQREWQKWTPQGEFARFDADAPVAEPPMDVIKIEVTHRYEREFTVEHLASLLDVEVIDITRANDRDLHDLLSAHREKIQEALESYLETSTTKFLRKVTV